MKVIKLFSYILLSTLILTSCIKDDSTAGVNPISVISSTQQIDTLFSVDRWDTLHIAAPAVTQTNTEKPLSYSWEIGHKVVSTDKDLTYVCKDFGKFAGRLKITNEDCIYYQHFNLDVRYSYLQGLYILASYQGKSILSYCPENVKGKRDELDVYAKNNPDLPLGTEPKAIYFDNESSDGILFLSTANPSALYRLNANMMVAKDKISTEEPVTLIRDNYGSSLGIRIMLGNRTATIDNSSSLITNNLQQDLESTFGTVSLANVIQFWYRPDGSYLTGEWYFDNANSRMLIYSSYRSPRMSELFAGQFTGMKLIGAGAADNDKDIVAVLKTPTGGYSCCWFYPGYYRTRGYTAPEMRYMGNIPDNSGMKDNSIITTASIRNIMYYSSGNNVYAYSVLSKGNFPTSPLFSCGKSTEEIASMFVNTTNDRLYVGTNDSASSDLKGSIYCFDINTNKLLWSKSHITGKIVNMAYKYQ
jgi:hypothetical protein